MRIAVRHPRILRFRSRDLFHGQYVRCGSQRNRTSSAEAAEEQCQEPQSAKVLMNLTEPSAR